MNITFLRDLLPVSPRRLREAGILGMNGRNAAYILPYNPRARYPRVDNKQRTKEICQQTGVPVPDTYGVISRYGDLGRLGHLIADHPEFVIKPAHGAAGRGIIVIDGHNQDGFRTAGRESLSAADLQYHISSILAGMFSLGARQDAALIEQRIVRHPSFDPIAVRGTPDIRVIVYRGIPAMAMVRLPTAASRGRANLHQGAVGAGIDLAAGRTTGGVYRNEAVTRHPDTGTPIQDFRIPAWPAILDSAIRLADALELGFVGIDLVVDAERGPLVLEANARPGLSIQIANRTGLRQQLDAIDRQYQQPESVEARKRRILGPQAVENQIECQLA